MSSLFAVLPDDECWSFLLKTCESLSLAEIEALRSTDHRVRSLLRPSELATRLLPLQPWAAQVTGLQTVAVWRELENIERPGAAPHRVTFEGASCEVRDESLPIVAAFGRLLQRFPTARLQIHAHTGRHAPPTYAPKFTRERAAEVAEILRRMHGISPARLRPRGWGKSVAIAARWPAGRESARGEMFVEIDGLLLPPLAAHYEGVDAATPDDSDEEEHEPGLSHAHLQLLVQMLQNGQLQGHGVLPHFYQLGGGIDTDEDPDEEEEEDEEDQQAAAAEAIARDEDPDEEEDDEEQQDSAAEASGAPSASSALDRDGE